MNKYKTKIEETVNEDKKNMRDKAIIYCINVIVCVILTAALSFSFSFMMTNKSFKSIEGVWVRLPDDNQDANGMKIIIRNVGGVYVGEVIDIDNESTMPIGTYKWNDFQKDSRCVFKVQDMTLSVNVSERYYNTSYILISIDGNQLTLYSPNAGWGKHQKWIRE